MLQLTQTSVRIYKSRYSELGDIHTLSTTDKLDWPLYHVFGFTGTEKIIHSDVPVENILDYIRKLQRIPEVGVIGVATVGINKYDSGFIARHGIGVH